MESQRIPDNFVKATETEVAALRLELLKQRVTSRDNLLELIDKYSLYAKERNLSRSDKVDLMRDRVEFSLVDIGLDITTMNGKGGEAKKVNGPRDRFATAFSVGFKSENPNIAAQVANSLVTLVLQEDVQHRSAAASETTKFLTKEADRAASELAKADSAIADFKDTNSAKLPEKLQYSTTQLDRQLREIEDLKRTISAGPDQKRLIEIEAMAKHANETRNAQGDLGPAAIDQQLTRLEEQLAQASTIYAPAHPEIRALTAQIASLKSQIANRPQAAVPVSRTDAAPSKLDPTDALVEQRFASIDQIIAQSQRRIDELNKSNDELQLNIQGTPAVTANLESLQRKRAAMQAGYDEIQIKLGQAKLGEQLEANQQGERFTVIESPEISTQPSGSKRIAYALGSAGLATVIGAASLLGAEFLDQTIWRSADIAKTLPRTEILVTIPYISTKREFRQYRWRVAIVALMVALVIGLALALFHFFVTPLDLLYYTMLHRL